MSKRSRARKAENAAQAQYWKALSEVKAIPELKKVATTNAKDIRENVGDNLSFRDRRQAKELDKLGQTINTDENYKNNVQKYNERYDILKRQLREETVVVKLPPSVPKPKEYDALGLPIATGLIFNGAGLLPEKEPTEKVYGPIRNGLRHHMAQSEEAYNDMQKLSKAVQGTTANAAIDRYSQIAERLKTKVKKEAANPQPSQSGNSLVAGELAQSTPYTETIT